MVLAAVRDLLFRSKIDAAARRLGVEIAFVPREVPLSAVARGRTPALVLADLGEAGVLGELRRLLAEQPAVRVVGFLGHLRTDLRDEAHGMGIEEVLTRGQLASSLDEVLSRAAGSSPEP